MAITLAEAKVGMVVFHVSTFILQLQMDGVLFGLQAAGCDGRLTG